MSTIRGREGDAQVLWEDIPEAMDSFRLSSEEFTDLGNNRVLVVGLFQGRGRRSHVEVNMRIASVYQIRDGMVASVRDYSSSEEALTAGWQG